MSQVNIDKTNTKQFHIYGQSDLSNRYGKEVTDEYMLYPVDDVKEKFKSDLNFPLLLLEFKSELILREIYKIFNQQVYGKEVNIYYKVDDKAYFISKGKLNIDSVDSLRAIGVKYIYFNSDKVKEEISRGDLVMPELLNPLIADIEETEILKINEELKSQQLKQHNQYEVQHKIEVPDQVQTELLEEPPIKINQPIEVISQVIETNQNAHNTFMEELRNNKKLTTDNQHMDNTEKDIDNQQSKQVTDDLSWTMSEDDFDKYVSEMDRYADYDNFDIEEDDIGLGYNSYDEELDYM